MENILKLIEERHSARAPFDPKRSVSKEDLRQILEAARWAPTAHNMQNFEIIVVDDKKLLKKISHLKRPISAAFIRENYPLLSFSEAELHKRKVGILGNNFPPAWRDPARLKEAAKEETVSTLGSMILNSSVLLIIVYDPSKRAPASEGDLLGHISLGCITENMWIMAQSLGISFHIVSSLGSPSVEKEAKKLLKIPASLQIVFSIRLGYPISKLPKVLRVRREVEDFTHHNQYGNQGI